MSGAQASGLSSTIFTSVVCTCGIVTSITGSSPIVAPGWTYENHKEIFYESIPVLEIFYLSRYTPPCCASDDCRHRRKSYKYTREQHPSNLANVSIERVLPSSLQQYPSYSASLQIRE